jgi:hypothetical protein
MEIDMSTSIETLVPAEENIGITVFYNTEENWINVLTCKVGTSVIPFHMEIFPYTDTLLGQWVKRRDLDPSSIYIFACERR